ncbi:MAG: fasciclin domain-containing protein [Balneolaceae bacterium]|nr:fasciclin domain-containing protein [Balneolaceae bacterium]
MEASNGVIHVIDEVILPKAFREPNIVDTAEDLGSFSTLVDALDQTGLKSTIQYTGPFTVFAPTDEAFNKPPDGLIGSLSNEDLAEILQYHVLSGEECLGTWLLNRQQPHLPERIYISRPTVVLR